MKRFLLALSLLPISCRPQTVRHETIAGRDVAVWLPHGVPPAAGGYPLIVFPHGFSGCNTQTTFLMNALAREGYLVLAPNHQDARCGSAEARAFVRPSESFGKAEKWSDRTYRDRAADIQAVLDDVLRERTFHTLKIDAHGIGLAGHSLGGYTVLGLAGGWNSWKDPRVKAVLALSAFSTPYIAGGNLARMNVPVMYQGGTLDLGITPTVRRAQGAFDQSSAPKYYIEFQGAGHFAWTNLNREFQDVIDQYSISFFDRYLKASDRPGRLGSLLQKPYPRRVSDVRERLR